MASVSVSDLGTVCAVTKFGNVYCWGDDSFGQLGSAATTTTCFGSPCAKVPVSLGLTGVGEVKTGGEHTCFLSTNGVVECWGANQLGQCGTGSTSTTVGQPTVVGNLNTASDLSAASWATCAIVSSGAEIDCWGDNLENELGVRTPGSLANSPTPVVVP